MKVLINAVTGQVKSHQIHMSGNATNQELIEILSVSATE